MLQRNAIPAISLPDFGEELSAAHESEDLAQFLLRRRSSTAKCLGAPGPSPEQISHILAAGARVPDHGKLSPWRFILFEGEDRAAFGRVIGEAFDRANPEAPADQRTAERDRFMRAPLVIAVISKPVIPHKIPEWEQLLSAGAVCQTMLIAGQALGFAGQWLTEWYAYDKTVLTALGLQPTERVAGYLYFGTAKEAPRERVRPDLNDLVSRWAPQAQKAPGAPSL